MEVAGFELGRRGEWRGIAYLDVILSSALMNSSKLSKIVPTLLLVYGPGFLQLAVTYKLFEDRNYLRIIKSPFHSPSSS